MFNVCPCQIFYPQTVCVSIVALDDIKYIVIRRLYHGFFLVIFEVQSAGLRFPGVVLAFHFSWSNW